MQVNLITSTAAEAVDADTLARVVQGIFSAAGLSQPHAQIVAECLVDADLRGAASHGVIRVPSMIARLTDGGADPLAMPQVVSDKAATMLIDGQRALGPISADVAMEHAIAKASEFGISVVGVRNSDFIGTCAFSAMKALEHGMIGLTWTNGAPGMAPFGGAGLGIGNNPVAFAIPGTSAGPVVLDIAMSVVAGGKIRQAIKYGRSIPEGWIIDADGNDTTDPTAFTQGGALLPLGHKGFGLAVIGEILAGVLTDSLILNDIGYWYSETGRATGNGHLHIVIDIAHFLPLGAFTARMEELQERLTSVKAAPGSEGVRLPGKGGEARRAERAASGLLLPENVLADIQKIAATYNVNADGLGHRERGDLQ